MRPDKLKAPAPWAPDFEFLLGLLDTKSQASARLATRDKDFAYKLIPQLNNNEIIQQLGNNLVSC